MQPSDKMCLELEEELSDCREKLAAAEARIEEALPTIQAIGSLANAGKLEAPGGEGAIVDLVQSAWKTLSAGTEALDAALEQARDEGYQKAFGEAVAAFDARGWEASAESETVETVRHLVTLLCCSIEDDEYANGKYDGEAEERERCAAVVLGFINCTHPEGHHCEMYGCYTLREIAAAIRNQEGDECSAS